MKQLVIATAVAIVVFSSLSSSQRRRDQRCEEHNLSLAWQRWRLDRIHRYNGLLRYCPQPLWRWRYLNNEDRCEEVPICTEACWPLCEELTDEERWTFPGEDDCLNRCTTRVRTTTLSSDSYYYYYE